jgi:hypothetical protein
MSLNTFFSHGTSEVDKALLLELSKVQDMAIQLTVTLRRAILEASSTDD